MPLTSRTGPAPPPGAQPLRGFAALRTPHWLSISAGGEHRRARSLGGGGPDEPVVDVDREDGAGRRGRAMLRGSPDQQGDGAGGFGVRRVEHATSTVGTNPPQRVPVGVLV